MSNYYVIKLKKRCGGKIVDEWCVECGALHEGAPADAYCGLFYEAPTTAVEHGWRHRNNPNISRES